MNTEIYPIIAKNIAETTFAGKKDWAGAPYIQHLERVANKAKNHSVTTFNTTQDRNILEALGWLHNLLEDFKDFWTEKHLKAVFRNYSMINTLDTLTKREGEEYMKYIQRVRSDGWARIVKIAYLEDNMDITRFKRDLTENHIAMLKKYQEAYLYLTK